MSPDEEKRRKSVAYILRRIKRGPRVGANSGEVVEVLTPRGRGKVAFQSSGSASGWWRFLCVLAGIAIFFYTWIVFALPNWTHWSGNGGIVDLTLLFLLYSLAGLIATFAVAYICVTLFRILRSNLTYRNE